MLGTDLNITIDEKKIAVIAIKEYIPTLKPGEVSQYQLVAVKFLDKKMHVDGISMRCAENALRQKAKTAEYKLTRLILEKLANEIEKQRLHFQNKAWESLVGGF